MFTSTMNELLGIKKTEGNEILPNINDDEYESSSVASEKESLQS